MKKQTIATFSKFIKENLRDGKIKLYPSDLTKLSVNRAEIMKFIEYLKNRKVVDNFQIAFAPKIVQSTYPKHADFSSAKNDIYSIPVFFLEINESKLLEFLTPKFSEKESALVIGGQKVSIPPYKNEYYLVKALFQKQINEFISWDVVYEDMTGKEISGNGKQEWRKIYDAANALNNRVKKETGFTILKWEELTIRRLL